MGYPLDSTYLHDPEVGWAIFQQTVFLRCNIQSNPAEFHLTAESSLIEAKNNYKEIQESDITGRPFSWDIETANNLLLRTLM